MKPVLIKTLFLGLGAILFAWAVSMVDIALVGDLLLQMGIGFVFVLLIYFVVTWVDAIAWRFTLKPDEEKNIPTFNLWRIRQIGESFNIITPFGTVGGEPVKAQLLKDHHGLSFKQGLASQVVARTTFLTALIFFMIPGAVLIGLSDKVSDQFKWISLVGLVTFSTLIFIFLLFQATGSLGKITRWMGSKFPALMKSGFIAQLEALDEMMTQYYRSYSSRFFKSIAWALSGWFVGLGELYVTLHYLGQPVSWESLWIMEVLSQLVRVGTFFIPLSIGAQEGGLVLIFVAMGLSGDVGLAVSFVRRIKELIWVGLGLLMGWAMAFNPSRVSKEPRE